MSKKISVILPIYNVAPYLGRCLDSILQNTYRDLEVICVNDGSTDDSEEILRDYAGKDDRIILVNKENGGVSAARNTGLTHARGEYIAFVDPDDWVHEKYFEVLLNILEDTSADVSLCDLIRTSDENALELVKTNCSVQIMDGVDTIATHGLKTFSVRRLIRREVAQGVLFNTNASSEDVIYNIELVLKMPDLKVAYTPATLYAYYIREGSLVTKIDHTDIYEAAEQIYEMAQRSEDNHLKNALYKEVCKKALFSRYSYALYGEREKVKECNRLLWKSLAAMSENIIAYRVFYYLPFLYRLFRIANDPTMLEYEKSVKTKLRG